ncbi:MAG TPA: ABC transporter permease [Micromonosporaceae bacterium]|jgi:osmoprotectant transport system permease protein
MRAIHQAIVWLNDPLNWTNPGGILTDLKQHLWLSFASIVVAMVIALPIGLWIGHVGRGAGFVVVLSNMTRAIPTYGMLTILACSSLGLGAPSVVPALALFAIPPVLANTYTGMRQVDPEARDAAKGMGMSGGQVLRRVELPLAMPYIATGVRSASVQVVATATLAALAAGGGLGTIIDAGFQIGLVAGAGQILAGGVLVLLLALVVNIVTGVIARWVTPAPLRDPWRLSGLFRVRRRIPQPSV